MSTQRKAKAFRVMTVLICIGVSSFAHAGKSVYVIVGDTIEFGRARCRPFGIVAPESEQKCKTSSGRQWPCGAAALAEINVFVRDKNVVCEDLGDGEYGPRLGLCRANGRDVSATMVDKGLDWSFKRYCPSTLQSGASRRSLLRQLVCTVVD